MDDPTLFFEVVKLLIQRGDLGPLSISALGSIIYKKLNVSTIGLNSSEHWHNYFAAYFVPILGGETEAIKSRLLNAFTALVEKCKIANRGAFLRLIIAFFVAHAVRHGHVFMFKKATPDNLRLHVHTNPPSEDETVESFQIFGVDIMWDQKNLGWSSWSQYEYWPEDVRTWLEHLGFKKDKYGTSKPKKGTVFNVVEFIYLAFENGWRLDKQEAYQVFPEHLKAEVCVQCGVDGTAVCGKCLKTLYCGADCQRMHWKTHKLECSSE